MSDIFTLKTVSFTPELGMALKNFRIENKVTAKSIVEKFDRASSYISKLEKGDIKKIDSDFLIELCNFISRTDNGINDFIIKLTQNFTDFSGETKFILMNIDDLLIDYPVPSNFVTDINEYLSAHNITSTQLINMINSNPDLDKSDDYNNLPINIWFDKSMDIDNASIKFSIPPNYIEDLLNNNIQTIHRVIAEGILYSLYTLGNEENARSSAHDKLKLYHIIPKRNAIRITSEDIENLFNGLEPDTAKSLKTVISGLKLITSVTKGYGASKIKQISNNMSSDLGFCFAFMSVNLEELQKKDKTKKQEFLNELKDLISKYSQEDTGLDMYE